MKQDCLSFPSSPSPFHYDAQSIGTRESGQARNDIPEDVRRYLRITEQAQFYEHMMKAFGIPITSEKREAFKKEFFGKVFYCKPNYYTKERKAFQAEFPTVLEHINTLKKDDPRNAPLALQRAESDFVIGTVCKRILKEFPETPLWTIHDSIMAPASRGEFVRKVMEEEFGKLGVHPRLHIEEYPCVARSKPLVALTEIGTGLLDGNPLALPLHCGSGGGQDELPLTRAS